MSCLYVIAFLISFASAQTILSPNPLIILNPQATLNLKCLTVLKTNSLLEARCSLPRECGIPITLQLSRNWLGNERLLCYNINPTGVEYINTLGSDKPPGGIAHLFNVEYETRVLKHFVAVHTNEWCLYTKFQIRNIAYLNSSTHIFQLSDHAEHNIHAGNCYDTNKPQPLFCSKHKHTFLKNIPSPFNPTLHSYTLPAQINETHALDFVKPGYISARKHAYLPYCKLLPLKTAYTIPFLHDIEHFLLSIIDTLFQALIASITYTITTTILELQNLNQNYYIYEYVLITLYTLHKFEKRFITIATLAFSVAIIGINRQ